jgi:hypothetical protein
MGSLGSATALRVRGTGGELDPRSRVTELTAYQAVSSVRQYDGSYHSYK